MNREISAWEPGDPQVEWTGRADGIEDAQLDFSDIRRADDAEIDGTAPAR